MAAYFQLLNLKTGEPEAFNKIDEQLCQAFNQPVDDDKYLCDWYNAIGWRVAVGKSLDQVRTDFINGVIEGIYNNNPRQVTGYNNMIAILNWISNHYTTNSWYQR